MMPSPERAAEALGQLRIGDDSRVVVYDARESMRPETIEAFADASVGLGYGYVTDKMRMELEGDIRDVALRPAVDQVLSDA